MTSTKKAKKIVPKIRKYDDGYFVGDSGPTNRQVSSGLSTASGMLQAIDPSESHGQVNKGSSIGSGALSGAAEGATFGPWGAAAGAVIGGTMGLINANKKQKQYDEQGQRFITGQLQQVQNSLTTANVNPYGTQMYELGDVITSPSDTLRVDKSNFHYNSPLSPNQPLMVDKGNGVIGQWGNPLGTNNPLVPANTGKSIIQPAIYDGNFNNLGQRGRNLPNSPTPNVIPHPSYAFGGPVRNPGVTGKFKIPNSGFNHFAPHLAKHDKINSPINAGKVDFNKSGATNQPSNQPNLEGHPQEPFETPQFADGSEVYGMNSYGNTTDFNGNETNAQQKNPNDFNGTPVNTQQNKINVQKGELLIDPSSGKVIQNYNGINPLTGGLFEPHSKDQQDESQNNFTLADPGLFVITKKTAPQYKEAIDNNDKISQKTVLMNIRNAKIQKEGGLKPRNYADGDTVDVPNPSDTIPNPVHSNQIGNFYQGSFNPQMNYNPDTTFSKDSVVTPSTFQSRNSTPSNTFGNTLDNLTKYGPGLVNLAQGTFGQTQTQPYSHAAINPYLGQIQANMPKDIDMGPVISDIRSTQNLENKNLENNTNNAAVVRANRQQIGSNTNRNLVNARMQGQEINNQSAGQRAYMYNALGYQSVQDQQQRRQYDLGVDDINARRTAAKQNLFNAGLSQLQQTSMNDQQNQQKAGMDKYTLGLMSQIFPNLKYYDDFNSDKVNKMLGR